VLEAGSGVMCCLRLGVVGADSTGLTLDLFSSPSYLIMVPIYLSFYISVAYVGLCYD